MIVYFDESYDNAHRYLLYGALFIPKISRLHQRFNRIRKETGFRGEVKYTKCRNARALAVCKKVVESFLEDDAYFRCVVVEQHHFDYSRWGRGDEPEAIKRARAYKKFAEMLLHPFVSDVQNAVFLADFLNRCRGDEFLERLRDRFNPEGCTPTFRHLAEVSSKLEQYQCLQICDLLLGCVLNNLVPPANRWKNEIRKHLCDRINVPNFLLSTWRDIALDDVTARRPKFHVWYWPTKKWPR